MVGKLLQKLEEFGDRPLVNLLLLLRITGNHQIHFDQSFTYFAYIFVMLVIDFIFGVISYWELQLISGMCLILLERPEGVNKSPVLLTLF